MAKPSQADLKKKEEFKASLIKKVGGEKASEKSLCTIVRSNIRQTWMMHPVRLLKLELTRIPDMDPTTRTKWLWECECCKGRFKGPDVVTDHIKGEHQLKSFADMEQFAKSILHVSLDDLQILCHNCHDIKTYSERYDVSLEYAETELKVIDWLKPKVTSVDKQKKFLTSHNLPCNNGPVRRDSYRIYLNEFSA